ncbi:MAG: DUF885 family protein [Phenylobacterium sp.]|nr:MAG: DUF885 family protein [Phenylobacterium sp.]
MIARRAVLVSALAAGLGARAAAAAEADYRAALSVAYGGPVDPVLAHARATDAARVAQDRADSLLRSQGLAAGSVAERLRALARDARFLYPDDEAGCDRAVAGMNARIARLRPSLAAAFGALPIAQAEVRRMPPAAIAAGKGGYREPGAYYVDLRKIRDRPAWTLASVAFHEVIPGHLLQLPLQAAANPPAERVKASGAYFEAWGIYAEQLARDLGAYARDPLAEIGYLQWRLFRLGRVIADIGLGALGWSPDRAIAVLTELQAFDVAFVTIEADVARMVREPGRFAADGLGALEIARLRPRDRVAWPAFHRKLLIDGPWPPGRLAEVVAG